jgi:cystine transport system substrate-binding protein
LKKISVFVLLASIFLLGACSNNTSTEGKAEESSKWAEIEESGKIVVGTTGTLIGASYYDGDEETEDQLTGYEVETMREIAKRLNLDIEFEILGHDNLMPAIKSGRIDITSGTITDKRKEEFDFSDPYKYSYIVMAVRESDNSGIESLEDLKGKRAGGSATTIYSQISEQFGAEIVTYGNAPNEAYLRDVSDGTTDVVVNDYYLTKFGVAAFPDFDLHLHPTMNFNLIESGVTMLKGEVELKTKLNEVLEEMHEDGTLSDLSDKFYGEDASVIPEKEIIEIDNLDI